ncbi:MAG: hypothetical protein Q4G35_04610 [Propionibacteriaceae bacterium]|nr:hypothetical protein [Propionibacteriaceae bacterium]
MGTVVDIAAGQGLDVVVDALQGHLSSYDFLPSWVTSWHGRNLFTDPAVRGAQRDLTAALAHELADRPNTMGLSVGNEFIQFAAGRHPSPSALTVEEAGQWLDELLGTAKATWPMGEHTHSFDDDLWFDPTHPFTPELATTKGDLTTVHSWVFGALGPRLGKDHPSLPWFARYLCELANAWSPDPNRPVWLQEVGAPLSHISPEKAADFVTDTCRNLLGCRTLWGITWWCSHDVSRSLADFPELEHTLGLIDEHGAVKDTGRAFAEFIQTWRRLPGLETEHEIAFDAVDLAQARIATSPRGAVFDEWLELALSGQPARLVRR